MISGKPVKSSIARTSSPASRSSRGGAAGRDQLDAEPGEAAREVDDAALVRHGQQRAAHPNFTRLRHPAARYSGRGTRRGLSGSLATAPAAIGTTASHSSSCSSGRSAARTAAASVASGSSIARWAIIGPGVDALVDEVDRHAEDLDAVRERLLDRADAREGRQQRGVDVDDPLREAREERGLEQLHVAGEHDELDAGSVKPVGHRRVARVPVA